MQKGFTLAETLITMAVIGIIMALSIPAVIQSTNDTGPLFKKAYNTVESLVSDLINDTALYPSGELNNTFCNNFFSKINTVGATDCTIAAAVAPGAANQDAITTNAMKWYNLHTNFTAANCNAADTGIDDTINTCIKISIDVNGANKGANTNTSQANQDIFNIYVTRLGKVAVETSIANSYDEASLLQN